MGLAQAKNCTTGTSSITKLSFYDLPDDVVVHRASKLGVSFGNTSEEIACSVKKLKDVEKDMSLLILKNNLNVNEDDPESLYVSKVSGLCKDLTEEECAGMMDHTDPENRITTKKRGRKKV
jgi:hypothetical protein